MFLPVLLCLCLWRLTGVTGKTVPVKEGDSVTLNSDLTEIKDDDVIVWRFGSENTVIAEINKQNNRFTVYDDVLDGRFRDRLKLDKQTGSLTITKATQKHAGEYKLQVKNSWIYFYLAVIVQIPVNKGDSVTLNSDLTELKGDDVMQWKFENTLIAEIDKQSNRFAVFDDVLDWRFRDRLKLDKKTGSLTIRNVSVKNAGEYKLVMIIDGLSTKIFRVSVRG